MFDSYFTRTIGAEQDELCEDFMVVTKFYDGVMKDLIYHGFTFKGEKYVYFTSSAGQIRTKKTVFVKESVWLKHQKSIMCGLTVDDINAKGGNNPNKHLAYLALANSATDVWEEFDIDRTIVVDDFGTEVYGTFDFIDDEDYSVKPITKEEGGHAYIEHTDGSGMMLPNAFGKEQKNKMVRLPWVKGLLGVFDFKKFIEEKGGSRTIKDIYGNEHDIFEEDIQVIFTKSQFKMHKYYDSWEHYKSLYKENSCTAGKTNEEEDRIKDATINYQMLQSLTDITDDEILEIAKDSMDRIKNLCSSVDNIKRTMGITPYNTNMTDFQKAINMYPDLLNDKYAKEHVKSIKDSMVKRCKAGKLNVHGKYTFVVPDFYAACEHWFLGIENPEGLLEDGEVFCWLFRKNEKLDCLRSPHLYKEHPVRNNVACHNYGERQGKVREWFCTDAVYTSCKDLISRILQFDVDGDKLLVVADKKLVIGYTLFAPIAYNDGDGTDAKLVGFDIELAKAVVEYLNTTYKAEIAIEFMVIDWSQKEALLENGTIDLVWNGMTITPEREAGMSISIPYLANKQVAVIAKADATKYASANYDEFVTKATDAIVTFEKGSAGESMVVVAEEE